MADIKLELPLLESGPINGKWVQYRLTAWFKNEDLEVQDVKHAFVMLMLNNGDKLSQQAKDEIRSIIYNPL